MKTTSTTRFQFAATMFGALAIAVLAPAAAQAQPVGSNGAGGGCNYTDADGYDVPIDDGQDVFVDGKIVSCRGGTIVITTAPKANVGGVQQQQRLDPELSVAPATPKAPLVKRNVPTTRAH